MKVICVSNIYSFEEGKEYSMEEISNYIIGNIQVFIQNYFDGYMQLDINIINVFLKNFKTIIK